MKVFIRTLCLSLVMSLTLMANAQLVNCNPDPNGEPWIAGGLPVITPEILAEMESFPVLELTSQSRSTTLPAKVDNSQRPWFRPIFIQSGGCCGQASGIGYTFTYEINRVRNLNANVPENQYPTHFTWNFLNETYDGGGSWYYEGWKVIEQMGIPTVEDYGGMSSSSSTVWMTGYENYYKALANHVIDTIQRIDMTTPNGLDKLKHWLNDHGNGQATGGLANFVGNAYNAQYGILPFDSDDAGDSIMMHFGDTANHAWTIVGYNDDVKFDFNGDGIYTNPSNNMAEWEIGALKVANSWGTTYCNDGFVYVPYRLLATNPPDGIQSKWAYVINVIDHYEPELTLKMNVKYPSRRNLRFYADYAESASQNGLLIDEEYWALNRPKSSQYENLGMIGIPNNNDPIEFCLDYGQFFNLSNVGKVYFVVRETDLSNNTTGIISNFSLVDYRWNEIFELPYPYQGSTDIPIVNNGYTRLGIPYHLLPFEQPIQNNLTLATDRVLRRTVYVSNNAELNVNENVKLDMYGTEAYNCKLVVNTGASLVIGNNAVITAKRGNCEIIVNGSIQIGQGVRFQAENGASLKVIIDGQQVVTINGCNFTNATLQANAGTNGSVASTNNSSFSISNCTFSALGNQCEYALRVDGYSSIMLADNTVNGVGLMSSRFYTDGILLYNCGASGIGSQILRNTIKGCTDTGLTLYGTTADIKGKNEITQCFTGVKLFNGSTVNNFMGNCGASNASQTQYIHDNDNSEVYIYRDCMPQTFRFNCITNSGNGWFVEYEDNVDNGKGLCTRLDLEYNTWGNYTNTQIGNHFHYITNTNNGVVFDFLPKWSYGECLSSYEEEAQRKSVEADSLWNIGLYTSAKVSYKEIVTLYPNTSSALNAMKKLLLMEGNDGENYAGLHYYYLNDTTIQGNESLSALAGSLANKCDEFMEHYEQAIAWYEDIIENEETPYNDSIFATIDLGNLYLKMEGSGAKGAKGKLTQFVPKSAEAFAKQTDEALRKLKNVSRRINSTRELPEQYWTNLVTEQPEGYVVDFNGDVHLYSAEALAWLISVVNGLNGQEADDFNGKKVTLEANVDMSTAIWTAIAQGTNYGDPNPDRLKFCGTFDGNGFVISGLNLYLEHALWYDYPFSSFFGTLSGARIENVVLRHAYAEGRNFMDGKFFANAETLETASETRPTIIDRCFVEFDKIYKDSREENCALFGYNNEGIIKNCMAVVHKVDYPDEEWTHEPLSLFVWNNNGAIKNCASIADSLNGMMGFYPGIVQYNFSSGTVENCYSYIDQWFGDIGGFMGKRPRMGICLENWGVIRNCYYNTWSYDAYYSSWFEEEGVSEINGGEVSETMNFEPTPFFQSPYWELKDSVSVTSQTGYVYRTNELGEALLDWVLGQDNSENYNYWCYESATFMPNKLPVLCDLDITEVPEKEAVAEMVSVYPNPAKEKVTIDGTEAAEVQVYNALGLLVKTVQDTNEISVAGLPTGVYLMRIIDVNGIFHTERVTVIK